VATHTYLRLVQLAVKEAQHIRWLHGRAAQPNKVVQAHTLRLAHPHAMPAAREYNSLRQYLTMVVTVVVGDMQVFIIIFFTLPAQAGLWAA
jgi:hypothetical protein